METTTTFILIFLAASVRLLLALGHKAQTVRGEFELKKYFDTRHIIRWSAHILTAVTMTFFVPGFVVDYLAPKYFPSFTEWSGIGDFIIGFAGYDIIKFLEARTKPLVEKFIGAKIK